MPPGTIESAWAHDDDRQAPLSVIAERQPFAHQLGVLIVIQRGTGLFLVNDTAGDRATDDGYGGNVDETAHPCLTGCFQDMMSAHHVGSIELLPRPPEAELGPGVYNLLTTLTGSGHGLRIIQVPPGQLDSRERIQNLKEMFKIIFFSDLNTTQAIEKIKQEFAPSEERKEIISFIRASKRGITKKMSEEWEIDSG